MGVVWEWGSHYWGSLEFPVAHLLELYFFPSLEVDNVVASGMMGTRIHVFHQQVSSYVYFLPLLTKPICQAFLQRWAAKPSLCCS